MLCAWSLTEQSKVRTGESSGSQAVQNERNCLADEEVCYRCSSLEDDTVVLEEEDIKSGEQHY